MLRLTVSKFSFYLNYFYPNQTLAWLLEIWFLSQKNTWQYYDKISVTNITGQKPDFMASNLHFDIIQKIYFFVNPKTKSTSFYGSNQINNFGLVGFDVCFQRIMLYLCVGPPTYINLEKFLPKISPSYFKKIEIT